MSSSRTPSHQDRWAIRSALRWWPRAIMTGMVIPTRFLRTTWAHSPRTSMMTTMDGATSMKRPAEVTRWTDSWCLKIAMAIASAMRSKVRASSSSATRSTN